MKRIIIHWTAGGYRASPTDRQHYHRLIEVDGRIVDGLHPVLANAGPLKPGRYAAHTRGLNTGSIGVALCAMAGAQEAPFRAGRSPVTMAQMDALAVEVARLCRAYQIPVTRRTVLTHAEVQPTLDVAQAGKWDVRWLPDMVRPIGAIEAGDIIRKQVREALAHEANPQPSPAIPAPHAAPTVSPVHNQPPDTPVAIWHVIAFFIAAALAAFLLGA